MSIVAFLFTIINQLTIFHLFVCLFLVGVVFFLRFFFPIMTTKTGPGAS